MTRGTINVKLRPIKLAFLVNPNDKESLLKAIEINTFLWGGTYNPIIPTYERIPSKWKVDSSKDLSAKSVVSGYLDNFDPDYVVPMGKCADYDLDVGYRARIEDVSEILAPVEKNGFPNYGIGLFEVLRYLYQDELRFQPADTQHICIPHFDTYFHMFFSSVFGVLSENIDTNFWDNFAKYIDAEKIDCSASNYTEFLNPHKLFLRRMTGFYLESSGRQGKPRILFLNATKPLDIMDYWNLRAIGWELFPVPKQFMQFDKTRGTILDFIEENLLPSTPNPEVYHKTTILKSRSISEDEHEYFLNSIKESKVVSQTWYPHIWDESAREAHHVECCELIADTFEHDVSTEREAISFKKLDPEFMNRSGMSNKPCFANEIKWRLSDDRMLFAEAIPEGDSKQAISIVESIGLRDGMRLFKKGVVFLPCISARSLYLRSPQAEGVFTRWLESKGWTVKLSSPGHIAQQMLQQLKGIRGTWLLASEGIIQLLDKMNSSDGKFLSAEFVRDKIFREIANEARVFKLKGEDILYHLIATKIFQLGMKIQCLVCTKHSWYSIKENDYELQCPRCLAEFSFPADFQKVKWAYRTVGPFSSSNQADGAYTVLLTLRFFSKITFSIDSAMTPLLSFTAKKGKAEIEADLALFFQRSKSRHSKTHLIFAECKSFNSIQKKDIDRMKVLGKEFPGSILIFAKLEKSLSHEEKKILSSLVNRSRRDRKNGRPFNPILILTGIELLSEQHFYQNWEKTEGIHAKLAENCISANLFELCDFTQQIYLDMDPWDQ